MIKIYIRLLFCTNFFIIILKYSNFLCIIVGVKMSDFVIGIPIGIAIGIAIGISLGISIGKKQKPWSELTEEEKRNRMILIGVGIIILIFGFLFGLWQFLKF